MKKLFLCIFIGLICFTTSYGSDALKGLHTLDLTIEEIKNKVCGVTKKDIEREVKFILSNTPIKLKKDISIETIYISPTIVNAGSSCSGYVLFEIWNGKKFNDFRRMHLRGERHNDALCGKCDALEYCEPDIFDDHADGILEKYEGLP